MDKRDFLSSFFWLCLAIYILVESLLMGLGNWKIPGPGLFPFGSAVLLLAMSSLTLIKSLRKGARRIIYGGSTERLRWHNVVFILVAMFLYGVFLQRIGFVLCSFCLVFFFLRWIAGEGWAKAILVAFSITLGSYLLFNVFLKADLPKVSVYL